MKTQNTTTENKTNSLVYKTSKLIKSGTQKIYVSIRLNDECKNGLKDFSITGDIYKGESKADKNHLMGGCIHDEISKYFPEFKVFIKLHLADYEGIPMYAVENGFYHLTNGFNNTPINSPKFKAEFCECYRITEKQFEVLSQSKNKLQYAVNLEKLSILKQWKTEAKEAIELLEALTNSSFLVDSKKTQYHAPTPEELKEEEEKQSNGYYTKEAEQEREKAKQNLKLKKLEAERDAEIEKHNLEFEVKKQVLLVGGTKALDNCIFYNHTKTLSFNWKSWDKLDSETVKELINKLELPEGVKVEEAKEK